MKEKLLTQEQARAIRNSKLALLPIPGAGVDVVAGHNPDNCIRTYEYKWGSSEKISVDRMNHGVCVENEYYLNWGAFEKAYGI